MRYTRFCERGIFVGSGAVEAGCTTVICWRRTLRHALNVSGATGIRTRRSPPSRQPPGHVWTSPHNQVSTTLTAG